MEVLRAATYNGAWAIGHTDILGSLDAGRSADLVVLNTNPLDNISNVRSIHRVVKGGTIYSPEDLLKGLKGKIH
jgi:imidazolonepropionase-like amidohydrolase